MDFVEQLKSSVDIVKVVGEYVRLRRVGATGRYLGLCPFHQEKTPSFNVNQSRQFYKCFGCGMGIPWRSESSFKVSGKVRPSTSMTNFKTSPPAPQPKHL